MLAKAETDQEVLAKERHLAGWTTLQLSDRTLRRQLHSHNAHWQEYKDPTAQSAALERFHEYAYQWY
jgi:hypothetical protein